MAPTPCPLATTPEEAKGILKGVAFPCTSNVTKGKKGSSVLCVESTQKNWSHPLMSHLGFEAELVSHSMITESAMGHWSPAKLLTT